MRVAEQSLASVAGGRRGALAALACAVALTGLAVGLGAPLGAAAQLGERIERAEGQAEALRSQLDQRHEAALAAEAAAARAGAERERMAGLLASGSERRAALASEVTEARGRLDEQRRSLGRARSALSVRLVAIYRAGPSEPAEIAITAEGYDDLITRSHYMRIIEQTDEALATRVEALQVELDQRLGVLGLRRDAALAHESALADAQTNIDAVAAEAAERAAEQRAASDARDTALGELTARLEEMGEQAEARRVRAEVRAEEEAAERAAGTTGAPAAGEDPAASYPGGPYAIPTEIVMCESGGNYSALNPSSGAGGAYQIIPSTWEAYGGTGSPHTAPKAEQDRIAAEIWADSGSSAWVCAH